MINDPGNAGTASEWPAPRVNGTEQRPRTDGQRALTGALGVITGAALIVATLGMLITGDWQWLAYAVAGWVGLTIMAAGIVVAVCGPAKRDRT